MLNLFSRSAPNYRAAVDPLARHGVAPGLLGRFAEWLAASPDRALFRLNPRLLADQLGLDERAALRLLIAAVYEGLMTLLWEVRCPTCGAIGHQLTGLGQIHSEEQCPMCQSHFAPALDEEVRVTFTLHERLRRLPPTADDPVFRMEVDARYGSVPGHALLVLPLFRRLFPQERVLPDESLLVTRVALLFTDLAGSTALYARRGDPRAYHLVRLHFDALFEVADRRGGTVVKTIGDAILGVFLSPVDALEAGLEMHHEIVALNERAQLRNGDQLILKMGLHTGPCLSVTLNDRPDYFGTTVNVAARVQGLSRGGDIVLTDPFCRDPVVAPLLHSRMLETSAVMLKGIDGDVLVHRFAI
jgi:class 3 adenylate cyclase